MTKEEAIKWLNRIEDKYIHGGDDDFDAKRKRAIGMAIEALKADRPRGEWADMNGNPVPLNEDGETTNSCWCSECGEWLVASDEYPTRGNFCPNCGADMRGERREE